ncbi:hypothetical protein HDU81_011278 [Chytriomyces hyalinus]|nr:hypothetical protein HDU81_011278 [Chytriomyces hyalinus]
MTAVDYLSHNFNEFDLHQCWRNATKHKDSLVNGRRLENASWRKFFQMKFALKTISPVHLNWNKDGDVNWLYGPFHTYEPLLQLQAAYRAAQSGECRGSECPGCPQCEPHSHPHANSNHLKPALKNNTTNTAWGKDVPLNMRDLLLMGIRASSDPDLFSTSNTSTPATPTASTTQAASAAGTLDFGATKRSLKSTFEKQQAAMAPLTGRKADFFLASAAERERRSKLGDMLGRSKGALERGISDIGSMDSFSSSTPGSPPVVPVARMIRFAEDTNVNLNQAMASAMEGLIQTAPIKVVGFTPATRKQQDEEEEEEDDDEEDVYVNQAEEPPKKKTSMFYSDDEDDSSDDDSSAQGFGLSFQGSKHSLLTVAAATSALSTAAAALTPIAAPPNVSSYPAAFSSHSSNNSSSSSGSGALHRTSSHEKGLYKLSTLSSAISGSAAHSDASTGPMKRTASFEKGLSKLSSIVPESL